LTSALNKGTKLKQALADIKREKKLIQANIEPHLKKLE
jgi:hypothetical protein